MIMPKILHSIYLWLIIIIYLKSNWVLPYYMAPNPGKGLEGKMVRFEFI